MSIDWNQRYEDGNTNWDKGAPAPALLELLARAPKTFAGRLLVPGCGRGHDLATLAEFLAVTEVIGLDLAPRALVDAHKLRGELHSGATLRWIQGNLLDPSLASQLGTLDGLWEHTCLCTFDPANRAAYAHAVAQLLRPGAIFAGVFYLDPGFGHDEGPPFGIRSEELDQLFQVDFKLLHQDNHPSQYPKRTGIEQVRIWRRS